MNTLVNIAAARRKNTNDLRELLRKIAAYSQAFKNGK